MKKRIWHLAIILQLTTYIVNAQDVVEGTVMEANSANSPIHLEGANVYWLNSPIGTITNEKGFFSIPYQKEYDKLVISYIGFKTDTLTISEPKTIQHWLSPTNQLDEVVVEKNAMRFRRHILQLKM